jgi:uncharacterized protein with NRDE domain
VCLILFSLRANASFPLIIAANRDESYARPAAPIGFWPHAPYIAGGRDLRAGGTWLGITRQGRWGALTNYRRGNSYRPDAPSRGRLVSDYLEGDISPGDYVRTLEPLAARFNGFNLLVGDASSVHYLSNREPGSRKVSPGVHGLSNHLLNTPWPKVELGKRALQALCEDSAERIVTYLLDALSRRSVAADSALPDTGIGQAQERVLSPPFIAAESYGTRASTVLLVDAAGQVTFEERTFGPFGTPLGSTSLSFDLEPMNAESPALPDPV